MPFICPHIAKELTGALERHRSFASPGRAPSAICANWKTAAHTISASNLTKQGMTDLLKASY